MTGQLALAFVDPIPVVEAHQRRGGNVRLARAYTPPLRKDRMWWRGRKWRVENVPLALAGVL